MQGHSTSSSFPPKDEEAYVKSLLEMSRSRRRKKKEELRELQNSLFHGNDDGNYQENDQTSPIRSSSRSRSTSPGFRGINSISGSWSTNGFSYQTSPDQQHRYTTPTISSEVRRVTSNYAHEQHKQLSDDIRSSYLLKRIEELKNMNIKAMIDRSFNSSSCVTRDQSQQTSLSNNNNFAPPTSSSISSPTNPPLSPHSKHYEIERRKRVAARQQEKLNNSPNVSDEKCLTESQRTPPQHLKRPSSARPSTQSQFQPQQNTIRSPEKFIQSQQFQNSILNNSSRKQHAPDTSKTPEKLTSTETQRPSSAPKSRVKQVETPKTSVPYNQRRVNAKPPLDPFEVEEKLILEQIQDLDHQLQKSVVFKSVVSSIPELPLKTVKQKDNDSNNSIASNRVSRPTTPSSSRRSNTRSPLSYSRCSSRPQLFETPKETPLEEITKKNREKYGHVKSKVVSRRIDNSGEQIPPTPVRNQRPVSASRGVSGPLPKQLDELPFSNTPKRHSSAPRKPRAERTRDTQDNIRSVNISLKNILLEREEYRRVWGEIEEEELRILKYTPKASESNNYERPEKDINVSVVTENSNNSFNFDFDNSDSNFKNIMKKRIEEIGMGLKKIASLDPDDNVDQHFEEKQQLDKNETQDIESHYCILFDKTDNNQSSYQPEDSSQLIEIDLEQSKISSCGEEDTTIIIEEKVSNNIDAFLSHGETEKVNESMLSNSFMGDTSHIPSNPEFRKFINDKLDMLEKECSLHQ